MNGGVESRGISRRGAWLLGLLAAAFALLRLLWLSADPPGYLSFGFLTDEGWYSQAARNHALFGRWVMDEHNVALVLCPVHTLALRASYALLGISFWSTRLVGATASALTVGLVAWRLRGRPQAAVLAAALVATHPVLFSLARVAYCESLQLFWVTLAWVLASDQQRRRRSWVLAGAAAGLAALTKASALYAPALVMAAPFITARRDRYRRSLLELAWVAAGGVMAVLPIAVFEWQFLDVLRLESAREGHALGFPPRGGYLAFLVGLTDEATVQRGFWPGVFVFLTFVGAAVSRGLLTRSRTTPYDNGARLAIAWVALSFGLLSLRAAPALSEHYWANLLVPLACLAALGCDARQERSSPPGHPALSWAAGAALAAGVLLIFRAFARAAIVELFPAAPNPLRSVLAVTIAAAVLVTVLFRLGRLAERLARARLSWQALAAAVALWGGLASAAGISNVTHTMRDASRALATGGANKVLTGDVANTFSIETPYRAFVCRELSTMGMGVGWVNGDWRALGATHWLVDRPATEAPPPLPVPGAVLQSASGVWPDAEGRSRRVLYVFTLPPGPG